MALGWSPAGAKSETTLNGGIAADRTGRCDNHCQRTRHDGARYTSPIVASSPRDLRESRLLVGGLLAALVVEHLVLVVDPLDVLYPVDPWVIGRHLWRGDLPYRDFGFEYPPLAALAFVLPGAVPHGLALSALAVQAVAAEAVVAMAVLRHHRGALLRYAVLSLLLFPFMSGGFDALPMAALAVSTALLAEGRAAGWWVAAAGTLVKLVPGVAWVWGRRPVRAGLVAMAVTAVLALAPALVADRSDDTWIGWTLHRGVQVESVAGTASWGVTEVGGGEATFEYRYRSWEIHGAGPAATGALVLAAAGLGVVAATGRRRPWLAALTGVLLLLAGAKVLSPQFVAWGAPLAAVVGGRWFLGYLGVAVLTALAYAAGTGPSALLGVSLVRNLALVGLAVAGLRQLLQPGPDGVDLGTEGVERP